MLLLFTLLTYLICLPVFAGDASILSLGFSEKSLSGVGPDLEFHRRLANEMGLPISQFTDANEGKEELLRKIAEGAKNSSTVILMYSGHGLAPGEANEEDFKRSRRDMTLSAENLNAPKDFDNRLQSVKKCEIPKAKEFVFATSKSIECLRTCRCEQNCWAAWNKIYSSEMIPFETRCYKACKGGREQQISCRRDCDDQKAKLTEAKIGPYRLCRYKCDNDPFGNGCGAECARKYAISGEDLARALKGKKVVGFVDACHSGALRNSTLKGVFWAASESYNPTAESFKGGEFTMNFKDAIQNKACRFNVTHDGILTLDQVFGKSELYQSGVTGCVSGDEDAKIPKFVLRKFDWERECKGAPSPGEGRSGQDLESTQ